MILTLPGSWEYKSFNITLKLPSLTLISQIVEL